VRAVTSGDEVCLAENFTKQRFHSVAGKLFDQQNLVAYFLLNRRGRATVSVETRIDERATQKICRATRVLAEMSAF